MSNRYDRIALAASRDLVNRELLADPAQQVVLALWGMPAGRKDAGGMLIGDDRAARDDRARGGEPLDAGRDVDGLAEIVLTVVEHDGQARTFMDADLEEKILVPVALEVVD